MSLNVWTETSGYSFGTFEERKKFDEHLPVTTEIGVTYTKISGDLPPGLRIVGKRIQGTPYEVPRDTVFLFCIRASKNNQISDRTFKITITGADVPDILTPAGFLDIGANHQLFAMDKSYVDYQINVVDTDTAVNQSLTFFISDNDGELPPGLTLTPDGRIVGYIKPIPSIAIEAGAGNYDDGLYDSAGYDFGERPTNGFDSYGYDYETYDYSTPVLRPKFINRNYEFKVTVTDGETDVATRIFKILVVNDDYFRSDITSSITNVGLFTADASYLRSPVWLTKSDLGIYRANNYITVKLDVYDVDRIFYTIDDQSSLPPGMMFDQITGDLYGRIPYQSATTKTYSFTVTATRHSPDDEETASTSRTFTISIIGEIDSAIIWHTDYNLGTIDANYQSTLKVVATNTVPTTNVIYKLTGGSLPYGLSLNETGEITGKVTQYANLLESKNGLLTFDYSPTLITTFDANTTTFDRKFEFTITASDMYYFSTSSRTFTLEVLTPNNKAFSNIRAMPFLKPAQRDMWRAFIHDPNIFPPELMYRFNDQNFGVRSDLSMLVYAGIETKEAAAYVGAMGLNHKKKRFHFGSVSKALAKLPNTTEELYEVVYINMIDPMEPANLKLPTSIKLSKQLSPVTVDTSNSIWSRTIGDLSNPESSNPRPLNNITVDSTGYSASSPNSDTYYPSSISNWRDRLSDVGESKRNYMPIWMRSIQPDSRTELGFTLSVPLCYCKVGSADTILLNIKHSNFNFSLLDYTIDRFIIDEIEGHTGDKYLIFRDDKITIG